MIKAVIFDVGGVLVKTHDHSHRREWERRLDLDDWESEEIVFNSPKGTQAQSGQITNSQLWSWVGEQLSLEDADLQAFRRAFWAGDRLDQALVAYIRSLRPHYQTAIISNATDDLRRTLSSTYPIEDAFDLIVCSAEEQVMKPDQTIYRRTLERLEREPQEAVFIDDNADNVAAAQDLGMYAVHYQAGMDLPARLAELGVEPASNNQKETN